MTPGARRRNLIHPEEVQTLQPPSGQKKGVDYARVSSKPQDKMSLGTQHDDNRAYGVKNNIRIVRSFGDVGTGLSTKNRPQFLEMVEYVLDKRNGITEVIFFDLARFTRRNRDFYNYTEDLEKAGIYLHSVAENQVYSRNSAQTWHAQASANEGSSRSTSFHTKRGQRGAIRDGYFIGKKAPYGYRVYYVTVKDEKGEEQKHPKLEPHPEQWPHLLTILGMGLNNDSPLTITKYLNDHNIPGPTGKRWTEDTVRFILHNLHNIGYTCRGMRPRTILPGRPEEMPVEMSREQAHEEAIKFDDYVALQDMILARDVSKGPTRSHSSPHLFSNITKCAECKTPEEVHNMLVIRDHRYEARLRCAKKKNQGAETCPKKNILMVKFEDLIVDRFINYVFTEENVERQLATAGRDRQKFLSEGEARKADLEKKLREIDQEIRNGNETVLKYGTKFPNLDSLMESINKLETGKAKLTWEIERIVEDTEEARLFLSDREEFVAMLKDVRTYIDSGEAQDVKELLKSFISRIEVFNDHTDIYYHLSPNMVDLSENLLKETIGREETAELYKRRGRDRKKSCLLAGFMGICTALNSGAMAVSRLTSSQRARASCVSTSSSPVPAVVESMAALRLDCQSSSIRGLAPAGSRNCADSRLRAQARSRWSMPAYLPNSTLWRSPAYCWSSACFSPWRLESCSFENCEPSRSTSSRSGGISAFIRDS